MGDRGLLRVARVCLGWAVAAGATAGGAGAVAAEPQPGRHMVIAAHPLAAEAGLSILRDGGTAADAAIAVQMVLSLVEPQASGIGGGALLLHYAARTQTITSYDGRETAPAAAGPDLFLDRAGRPLDFATAGVGGRAVGVPGVVRMLELLHKAEGKLPWDRLFAPAIRLAETGVPVSSRLAHDIAANADGLRRQTAARMLFFRADGTPLAAGDTLVNKPLADTLRAIAAGGADAIHRGPIAAEIATTVRTDPNAGLLTADDMAAYAARRRDPLCGRYRDHLVCTAGPPSGGGVTLLETLGMLSQVDLAGTAPPGRDRSLNVDVAHLMVEAERLAQADRALYLADTDYVSAPLRGLLSADYLADRARLIRPESTIATPRAGAPARDEPSPASRLAPTDPQPEHGTSALAVVDDAGNAVSMTTTVQDAFGARLVVRGFLLNNALTDFSFEPERDGAPVANRVEPGKRPLSAMAPAIVLDPDGRPKLVAGAAGGAEIPGYLAQSLVELLDFGTEPQAALAVPHVDTVGTAVQLEAGTAAADLAGALRARGHAVSVQPLESGLAAILVTPSGLRGAADRRREGVVLVD